MQILLYMNQSRCATKRQNVCDVIKFALHATSVNTRRAANAHFQFHRIYVIFVARHVARSLSREA